MGDIREQEVKRWKEREEKDLEVERKRGPRPLEGFSGAGSGTTWTSETDERAASDEHADDKRRSEQLSEKQAERREPDKE